MGQSGEGNIVEFGDYKLHEWDLVGSEFADEMHVFCTCGNRYFSITLERAYCSRCGKSYKTGDGDDEY